MLDMHIKIGKDDKYILSEVEFFTDPLIHNNVIEHYDTVEIVIPLDNKKYCLEGICSAITELIIKISQYKILKEYISKIYKNEDERDINQLYQKSSEVFDDQKNVIKKDIVEKVREYIKCNEDIDVYGFITFRMKELDKFMALMLDIAMEKYVIEKEQEDMTSILRYLINIQEEKIDQLKIHIKKNGSFIFYDKNNEVIKNIELDDIETMIEDKHIDYEDVFVSNLLSFCPEKIEIEDELNDDKSKQVLETIKTVFGKEVVYTHVE